MDIINPRGYMRAEVIKGKTHRAGTDIEILLVHKAGVCRECNFAPEDEDVVLGTSWEFVPFLREEDAYKDTARLLKSEPFITQRNKDGFINIRTRKNIVSTEIEVADRFIKRKF